MNGEGHMKNARYTDEFKAEAIKQITERGHGVLDVSKRLGVVVHARHGFIRRSHIL